MGSPTEDWRDYADLDLASGTQIGPTPRMSGPYDWTDFSPVPDHAVWPSAMWANHLAACPDELRGVRCAHPIAAPEWWRAIISRGDAYHPRTDEALRRAAAFIRGFRGHPALPPDVCTFVREATLDGLCMAPAPVTPSWLHLTLAPVAGLARWADLTGRPLTRDVVFSEETIRVWLQGGGTSPRTSGLYLSRLWLLGGLFSGDPQMHLPRTGGVTRHRVTNPHTPSEVAALWRWTRGLPRHEIRHRVRACLILGLGCGLQSSEMTALNRADVTITPDGIDVVATDTTTKARRSITCLADWEDPLVDLLAAVPAKRPILTPWNKNAPSEKTNANVIANAQLRSCPVPFTTRSLRHTWILRHLAIGTPVDVILAAAGMQDARRLTPLIRMLSDPDPATARRALRGKRTTMTTRLASDDHPRPTRPDRAASGGGDGHGPEPGC